MSGFSPEWLTLREPADHRARDAILALMVAERFQKLPMVTVRDLGCGTGSNVRATYALLGPEQHWTLVDYDARLLAAAREHLTAWADRAEPHGDKLELMKSGKRLLVGFTQVDLVADLERGLGNGPVDLITASAFFDLCSMDFIDRFAAAVAVRKAAFYTVLTYNGVQRWTPKHEADASCAAAFHAHQKTDKGFGTAAGPDAPKALKSAFVRQGYRVDEGDSPWLLTRSDQPLIDQLAQGFAGAVEETGAVPAAIVKSWRALTRHGSEVGHTDTFAVPPA
jgi:SAM-dependent methyltransferase